MCQTATPTWFLNRQFPVLSVTQFIPGTIQNSLTRTNWKKTFLSLPRIELGTFLSSAHSAVRLVTEVVNPEPKFTIIIYAKKTELKQADLTKVIIDHTEQYFFLIVSVNQSPFLHHCLKQF